MIPRNLPTSLPGPLSGAFTSLYGGHAVCALGSRVSVAHAPIPFAGNDTEPPEPAGCLNDRGTGTGHAELSCSAHFRQYSALANSIPITAEATTHGSSTSSSSSSSSSRIRHAPHPHLRPRWTHMHATHQHAQHRLYAHAAHAISPAAPAAAAADAGSLGRGQYGGRAAGAGGAGGAFRPGGPQRLSPRAQEFSREFYALVNIGLPAAAPGADGSAAMAAAEAQAVRQRSYAIRRLQAFIHLGQTVLNEKRADAAAAEGAPPAGGAVQSVVGVDAEYLLDQALMDRAWRTLQDLLSATVRQGLGRGGFAAAPAGSAAASSPASNALTEPMTRRELLEAAEWLAAYAGPMGLAVRDAHYRTLMRLYHLASREGSRAQGGLSERVLEVRQRMVEQGIPTASTLPLCLTALLNDRAVSDRDKLATARRLLAADMPYGVLAGQGAAVQPPAGGEAAGGGLGRGPSVDESMHRLMGLAAEQRDWACYEFLEATATWHHCAPPPLGVLGRALVAAAEEAAGGSSSEGGAASNGSSTSRSGDTEGRKRGGRQLAGRLMAQYDAAAAAAAADDGSQEPSGDAGRFGGRGGWQQGAYGNGPLPDSTYRDVQAKLLQLAVQDGDDNMAYQLYTRSRQKVHQHLPKPAPEDDRAEEGTQERGQGQGQGPAAGGDEEGQGGAGKATAKAAKAQTFVPLAATLALLPLPLRRRDWGRVMDCVLAVAEVDTLASGRTLPASLMGSFAELQRQMSAYGGLRPLSEALIASEQEAVDYYTELLRHVGRAAKRELLRPFHGSAVPFGPPLRAAAARSDLASVSDIIKQMKAFGCAPSPDSYAAVVEASLNAGKPERVSGLLSLMAEEGVVPTAAVWEVQLAHWAARGDAGQLANVATVMRQQQPALHRDGQRMPSAREAVNAVDRELLERAVEVAHGSGDDTARRALSLLRDQVLGAARARAEREEWEHRERQARDRYHRDFQDGGREGRGWVRGGYGERD